MKNITVIFGTRPEGIKLAPVILKLAGDVDIFCRVCLTAQHRELVDPVLSAFGIIPDVDLDLMQENQTLCEFTGIAIKAIGHFLLKERPDLVLVQGDTTTVLCAALAAFYHRIPIGHIEAGLRTGNIYSPWPEEANRSIVSRIATLHFAPTDRNRKSLLKEGIVAEKIFVTGNTVIDALYMASKIIESEGIGVTGLSFLSGNRPMVLITGHRRESFGKAFESICNAIAELAKRFPDTDFVYPVHLNPQVREPVFRILKNSEFKNIHLMEPLPYLPFVALMKRANLILTDSGGLQEEAIGLGKPVMVMRDCTERTEGIRAKMAMLVGTEFEVIVQKVAAFLEMDERIGFRTGINPYGDGMASERIVRICKEYLAGNLWERK